MIVPEPLMRELLQHANDEDSLDVAEDELMDHHRTRVYREVIRMAYDAGLMMAQLEAKKEAQ